MSDVQVSFCNTDEDQLVRENPSVDWCGCMHVCATDVDVYLCAGSLAMRICVLAAHSHRAYHTLHAYPLLVLACTVSAIKSYC